MSFSYFSDENVCPGFDWKYYAPHCYYRGPFGLDGKTFNEARSECLKMGADLVSIHSGEENNNVLYEVKRFAIVRQLSNFTKKVSIIHNRSLFKIVK